MSHLKAWIIVCDGEEHISFGVGRHGPLHFAWAVDDAKCILVTLVCLSVFVRLSLAAFPHYCTDPNVTGENGRGCPLVVPYWVDLQSVHRFRCYDNSAEREIPASACTRSMPGSTCGCTWVAGKTMWSLVNTCHAWAAWWVTQHTALYKIVCRVDLLCFLLRNEYNWWKERWRNGEGSELWNEWSMGDGIELCVHMTLHDCDSRSVGKLHFIWVHNHMYEFTYMMNTTKSQTDMGWLFSTPDKTQ